jgi:hypothetical protein
VYVRFLSSEADHRYNYARWNGTSWVLTDFAAAGTSIYGSSTAAEPHYSGGLFISRSNPAVIYASRQVTGKQWWRVWKYVTPDQGITFTATELTPGTITKSVRPVSPRNPEVLVGTGFPDAVWMSGTYTTFTNYATTVHSYPPLTGVTVSRSVSILVPDFNRASDLTLTLYYGNASAGTVTDVALDDLTAVTTSNLYALSAGGANT